MFWVYRKADINRSQNSKDEGLQKPDKNFKGHHHHSHDQRHGCHKDSCHDALKHKDHRDEDQDHHVSCCHVGKEPDSEREGSGELTDKFDEDHKDRENNAGDALG